MTTREPQKFTQAEIIKRNQQAIARMRFYTDNGKLPPPEAMAFVTEVQNLTKQWSTAA